MRPGFTLVELVSVLVIVAVLAATAAPVLSSLDDSRATMAARDLLRDLTWARQRAVATGTKSWVVFDAAAETWSVYAEDPANPGRANRILLTDAATGKTFVRTLGGGAFTGVGITSADFDSDVEIAFDWLGRPSNAAEIDLAAAGTATLSGGHVINVAVSTGHVTYVAP